ncbi:bystin-like [Oscarella lobularis]|uniref:bystin-like n=1 Tax=Oscarella lobularis TaxID=121494 RepID=UPI0033138C72
MGKDKAKRSKRHAGLAEQILDDDKVKPSGRVKRNRRKIDEKDSEIVDTKLSARILDEARKQQDELEEEFGLSAARKETKLPISVQSDDDDEPDADDEQDTFYQQLELDDADEKVLETFMCPDATQRRTLSDFIMEKIRDKETEVASQMSERSARVPQLDEKIVHVYKSVGNILARYRSGKLPKAFKFLPSLSNWEEVLYLTNPDRWTAASMYQATRIFSSNLNEKMAQRFYNLVLLPRIRDDVTEYKRLNVHLYAALKRSLFKPAAFFKGILLPLCESGTCTLREAVIVGSVLARTSVPVLHSSAALLKLAEMDYTGANSIFMRILLEKNYALPYRVVDALVYHFLRFLHDKRTLPVLWHQCFLRFVHGYKEDISNEQKDALIEVVRAQCHPKIGPEIRQALVNSTPRDIEMETSTLN